MLADRIKPDPYLKKKHSKFSRYSWVYPMFNLGFIRIGAGSLSKIGGIPHSDRLYIGSHIDVIIGFQNNAYEPQKPSSRNANHCHDIDPGFHQDFKVVMRHCPCIVP